MGSGSTVGKRARVVRALLAVSILAAATLVVVHVAPAEPASAPEPAEAAPDACHTHRHADYQGDMAVVWGMQFKVGLCNAASASACLCLVLTHRVAAAVHKVNTSAECCAACAAHAEVCGASDAEGKPFHPAAPHPCGNKPHEICNMWVFCESGGEAVDNRCFSFDIHKHFRGECWLKRQADPTRPTVGDDGEYPAEMRAAPRAIWPWAVEEKIWPWHMPEKVHWTSGVLLPPGSEAEVKPQPPVNFVRWCDAHGPCASMPNSATPAP